jgi:hypothetical protein
MNDYYESLISEWLDLPLSDGKPSLTSVAQSDYSNSIEHQGKASILMMGIDNDIKNFSKDNDVNTLYLDDNEIDRKATYSRQQHTELKPIGTKKSLEAVSNYNKKRGESAFYQQLNQYNGTIRSINNITDTFTAILINAENGEDTLEAEFSFEDYSFGSDRELIREGANFVWLFGQEVEHGSVRNVSKFIFRRTPVIGGKTLQEVRYNARELAKLFTGAKVTETSNHS